MIHVVSVRGERLDDITQEDVALERFSEWTPTQFIWFFCMVNRCGPNCHVNRIEFRCVDGAQ